MEVVSPAPIPVPNLPWLITCPVTNDTILTHRVLEVDKTNMYSRYTTEFDLEHEEYIASGAFGVVVRCKNIIDNQTYAIKKVSMGARGEDDVFGTYADLKREFMILAQFDHPSVVRYHTTWIESQFVGETGEERNPDSPTREGDIDRTKPCLYIQMQHCEGSLTDKMTMGTPLTMKECQSIFSGVVDGLKYIHGQKVMHGDLNKGNIFFSNGNVKIGDFGLSRIIGEGDERIVLTDRPPHYAPPDVVVSLKVDVFSLGIMLAEMLLNEKSVQDVLGDTGLINKMKKEDPEFPPDWPDGVLKTWITKMLKVNPEDRPSISEIVVVLRVIEDAILQFKLVKPVLTGAS